MSGRNTKREQVKVIIHRKNKAPVNEVPSDSSDEEEQTIVDSTVKTEVKLEALDLEYEPTQMFSIETSNDRRLQRLNLNSNKSTADDGKSKLREASQEESSDDEMDNRLKLKQQLLLKQQQQIREQPEVLDFTTEVKKEVKESSSSEEEETEYETDSSEETLIKPVFVPKHQRVTIHEREQLEALKQAEEERKEKLREQNKLLSIQLVEETIKKELEEEAKLAKAIAEVDDTDDIDPAGELMAWKLRELKRIKRDAEEKRLLETEQEALEARRALPENVKLAEDLAKAQQQIEEKAQKREQQQLGFMQRYHHKGAFFAGDHKELMERNFNETTIDDVKNRQLLPEAMQKRDFGKRSQSKYTHLVDQDTTKDAVWNSRVIDPNLKIHKKLGGMHDFDHINIKAFVDRNPNPDDEFDLKDEQMKRERHREYYGGENDFKKSKK